jgi:hypothetical protein
MCLSVYLGSSRPLTIPSAQPGELGVEKARWTPPPLRGHEFVYYLGAKSQAGDELGCSCLLSESVFWTDQGPVVSQDEAYPTDSCPFDALRRLCDEATRDGGLATIVCDDICGMETDCSEDDYADGFIRLSSIARGNLLFADVSGGFPSRALCVVR